jgi:hypothetical protein
LEIFEIALEVIDLRSFSNLWYWIALAVLWSSVSHWVLGVPHDMIHRARREGGQALTDVEDLVRINVNRLLHVVDGGALVFMGLLGFWMSALGMLAFYYRVEFAQALFLLIGPMMIVLWVSVIECRRIAKGASQGDALLRRLTIHRRVIQVIGMISIAVTGLYGTWLNISVSILN